MQQQFMERDLLGKQEEGRSRLLCCAVQYPSSGPFVMDTQLQMQSPLPHAVLHQQRHRMLSLPRATSAMEAASKPVSGRTLPTFSTVVFAALPT